jgi:hypothetical protein
MTSHDRRDPVCDRLSVCLCLSVSVCVCLCLSVCRSQNTILELKSRTETEGGAAHRQLLAAASQEPGEREGGECVRGGHLVYCDA